jgi:PAS domain S-box-containing protein
MKETAKTASDKPTVGLTGSDALVGETADILSEEESLRVEEIEREEVLRRVEDGSLDCIISGEGLELLRRVRNTEPELPFVLFSDGSTEKSRAAEAGTSEYVEAPLDADDREMLKRRVKRYAKIGHSHRKEYERELERSRELLSHTERIADTGGWELNVETGEQRWTDGTRRIHGVPEEYEPTVEKGIEFYHPEDREEIREAVKNCRENGEPYDKELRIITQDDELRWIHTLGEAVEEDGEVTKLRGAIHDITQRKRHERELERYEYLWKNIPAGICRVEADNGGNFLRANQRLVEMTGAESEEELLRHTTDDFWTDKEDRQKVLERVKGEAWVTTEQQFETLAGEHVWARITAFGYEMDEGMVLDAVVQDITDRKQKEEQLKKAEKVADMGSWYMDISSDRIFWSERVYELWDIDYEGPMDYEVFLEDYVHPDDEEFLDRNWQGAKEGEPYDIEYRLTIDGEVRWMREAADVTFENGEPTSATGVIQDITDRKEREQELEEQKSRADRHREQVEFFSHLLRHQLLNSITVVSGNAEMVLEEVSDDADCYDGVERIYERSKDMADTINRVRSVLKRIEKKDDRQLTPKNLSGTIEACVESLRGEHDVEVSTDLPDEAYVPADEFLEDVIDNILANAVEHNDKDEPEVDVEAEKGAEKTTVRIADNGPGIPDERKEKVFQQGVTGKTSGTVGFGLYFVDSMVSEYGGDIWVEDNHPEGAVFVIELPNADGGFGGDRG